MLFRVFVDRFLQPKNGSTNNTNAFYYEEIYSEAIVCNFTCITGYR